MLYKAKKMLYMTVWAIKHRAFVNNFAYETAEINIEVKHLLMKIDDCGKKWLNAKKD